MKSLLFTIALMASTTTLYARIPEITARLSSVEVTEATEERIRLKVSGDLHILSLSEKTKNASNEYVIQPRPAIIIVQEGELVIRAADQGSHWEDLVRHLNALSGEEKEVVLGIHGGHEIGIQYGIVKRIDVKGSLEVMHPLPLKREQDGADQAAPAPPSKSQGTEKAKPEAEERP